MPPARPAPYLFPLCARLCPAGFAVWLAHYGGSHFLGSALALIPVLQNFILDHHIALLGAPDWTLGPLLPSTWIDPLELFVVLTGFGAGLYALAQRAPDAPAAQLPWFFLLLLLAVSAMLIFLLPMEMRGML